MHQPHPSPKVSEIWNQHIKFALEPRTDTNNQTARTCLVISTHTEKKCKFTPKEVAAPAAATSIRVTLHLLSYQNNLSQVINNKHNLPVIVIAILRINTIKQNIAFKAVEISGSSAVTIFCVM